MKNRSAVAVLASLAFATTTAASGVAFADTAGPGHSHRAGHSHRTATAAKMAAPTKAHSSRARQARKPAKHVFHVASGYTFTNPVGSYDDAHAIKEKVLRTIRATPRGATIRMVSWNFDNYSYVNALTAAHDRGVSVRLIMARTLTPGDSAYNALKRNLQGHGNAQRRPGMRSWFRTCSHSCRGHGGAMHAKYFIFSRSGNVKDIVMNTSSNLTGASASIQWNEMYTLTNDRKAFDNYMDVFAQDTRDKPAPYHQFSDGAVTGWFYPRPGRSDLVMNLLDQVSCSGARKATGNHGHSIVRVAQDVFNNARGVRIARKLLRLKGQGCKVEVVFSQAVGDTRDLILRLPHNHLVQDTNGDGIYDKYLHAKLLAISGHIGKNHADRIVMDGSANYSATALQSDEQGMIIHKADVEKAYARFIDRMFHTHLVNDDSESYSDAGTDGRRMVVDPYSQMEG